MKTQGRLPLGLSHVMWHFREEGHTGGVHALEVHSCLHAGP